MRNDGKGKQATAELDGRPLPETWSYYASGEHGPEVRADGSGNYLQRGYYAKMIGGIPLGPFNTRKQAVRAAARRWRS